MRRKWHRMTPKALAAPIIINNNISFELCLMLFGLQVLYTYDGQWQAEIWLHKYHDTLRRMISHGCLVCTSTVADSCSVKFQGSLLNSDSLWEACGLLPCLLCRIIMNHHVYSNCKPNVTTLRIY